MSVPSIKHVSSIDARCTSAATATAAYAIMSAGSATAPIQVVATAAITVLQPHLHRNCRYLGRCRFAVVVIVVVVVFIVIVVALVVTHIIYQLHGALLLFVFIPQDVTHALSCSTHLIPDMTYPGLLFHQCRMRDAELMIPETDAIIMLTTLYIKA